MWSLGIKHIYCVMGSWTGGLYNDLKPVPTTESGDIWECQVRIGLIGMEYFHFARDYDDCQSIYPSETGFDENVPVRGPDELRADREWRITGKTGDVPILRLQVVGAHTT